jgi:hypothetical protein
MEDIIKIESTSPDKSSRNKKIIISVIIIAIVVASIAGALYFFDLMPENILKITEVKKPQVVEENLVIPDTQAITGTEGRTVNGGSVNVALVPKDDSEKVVVTKAVLTVKGSYELAKTEALSWSPDAKLVFVKSLGAVDLDGKSSQWQLAFSSASKKGKGYEVIIQVDQVASKKEIASTATGADVPANLKDSSDAIKTLQDLPQFSDATVSSINLYYNADGKIWRYALSTSKGTTSALAQ